jgi:hypothetical protein
MRSLHRQKGISLIGIGLLAFLIIFFGTLTIKMSGTYFDHISMDKMIENGIAEQTTGGSFNFKDLKDRLEKNMNINNISFDLDKVLTYDKRTKPATLVLNYEKRVHLFFNIDVVMSFNETYEL